MPSRSLPRRIEGVFSAFVRDAIYAFPVRHESAAQLAWSISHPLTHPHARPPLDRRRFRRAQLPQMRGRDVGQSRGEAQSEGARLQVQGPGVRRRHLATAWNGLRHSATVGASRSEHSGARLLGDRSADGTSGRSQARGDHRRESGLERHAPLSHLRRSDVGRPRLQAQSASAGFQVPQQAARARGPRMRGRHLAGARRLSESVPTTRTSAKRLARPAATGWPAARGPARVGRAAAGRRRRAFLSG